MEHKKFPTPRASTRTLLMLLVWSSPFLVATIIAASFVNLLTGASAKEFYKEAFDVYKEVAETGQATDEIYSWRPRPIFRPCRTFTYHEQFSSCAWEP